MTAPKDDHAKGAGKRQLNVLPFSEKVKLGNLIESWRDMIHRDGLHMDKLLPMVREKMGPNVVVTQHNVWFAAKQMKVRIPMRPRVYKPKPAAAEIEAPAVQVPTPEMNLITLLTTRVEKQQSEINALIARLNKLEHELGIGPVKLTAVLPTI